MYRILILSGLLLANFLWANAHASADLRLYGSNTVGAELAPALIKQWLAKKGYTQVEEELDGEELILTATDRAGKQLVVELDRQGSTTGFKALDEGKAEIAMSSRPIKPSEVDKLKPYGRCDTAACEYVIALDGIAIIVNPANPVARLSKGELRRIFSGEVVNWSELGGADSAIKVYSLDDNSGTYDTFKSLVLGKGMKLVGGAARHASHAFISEAVAKDPAAIGFVGLPFIDKAKALAVADGEAHAIKPGSFTVATEDYVLARRLFFYMPEAKANALSSEFVKFAIADAGQAVVDEIGFVSQAVLGGAIEPDEAMPEEYRKLTDGAQRLSLNFRFLKGAIKLDNKAQRDVARLKAFMAKPENRKRELMLFGFADSNESMPIVSLQLSVDRADNVADLLIKQGLRPGKVRGYGNAVPVASNDSEAGRQKNRRVEVWVR